MGAPRGDSRYRLGHFAEALAGLYLRLKGYQILARRYRSPVGEIDLIARKGRGLVFIEVKFRQNLDDAAFSILPRQRARILNAAQFWLSQNPAASAAELRFDVVLLAPFCWPRHIQHAFDESGV